MGKLVPVRPDPGDDKLVFISELRHILGKVAGKAIPHRVY